MRAHPRYVLFVTLIVGVGATKGAQAAGYVHRGLTLGRSDWSLDFGLGVGHHPHDTGAGLNFELAAGLTSFLQLGIRSGLRIDDSGRRTQADYFGRTFETETYGTDHDVLANPEISLKWEFLHGTADMGLDTRVYLPIEDGTRFGVMVAVPLALHIGRSVRLDTGIYVPILFYDPAVTTISFPLHLWIQADDRLYLGPLTGVVIHNPGGHTSVPFGFGIGLGLSYDVDLKMWLLFPDVSGSGGAKSFGAGIGLQVRF
jgi:hypothetical protein